MPTIGDALSLLDAELFVGRERELARCRQWLGAPTPRPEILNVGGPGGVGWTAMLHAFRWILKALLAEAGLDVFVMDVTGYARDPPGAHGRPCCRRCCTSRTCRAARACGPPPRPSGTTSPDLGTERP